MSNYGTINYDDLKGIASGPIPYLMQDFIPANSIGILVGEWGIGKSPFAIQMQMSLAAGIPFLDRYTAIKKDIKTLYVDLENGAQPVLGIADSVSKFLGLTQPPANWRIYSPNYSATRPAGMIGLSEEMYIRNILKEEQYDFVIIDPLRMYNPDAESKNKEAAKMIQIMRKLISDTGVTVMFIHHPRKQAPDAQVVYRLDQQPTAWMGSACGAASLIQNADFRIGFEQIEDSLVCRRFLRNQGWFPPDYISRFYDEDDNPIGYTLELGSIKLDPLEKQCMNHMPFEFTTQMVKADLGKGNHTVNQLLKKLLSLEVITKKGHGTWEKTNL